MLRLIERLIPAGLHRAGLRLAFRVRHHWRRWRKAPINGCNVILTDLRGDILLLRHSYGPDNWSLPGGGVDRGETPLEALKRELDEELGLAPAKLKPIGELRGEISGSPHTMHLFEAVIDQRLRPDNREVVEARFFPSHSLPEPIAEATRRALAHWRSHRIAR